MPLANPSKKLKKSLESWAMFTGHWIGQRASVYGKITTADTSSDVTLSFKEKRAWMKSRH